MSLSMVNTRNAHKALTGATGVETQYVEMSLNYLTGAVGALSQGKLGVAAVATIGALGSAVLAGTNALIPKDVKLLNKISQ